MQSPTASATERAKRAFDVAVAGAGLVALSPLLALVALRVKRHDGGPVFYKASRVGQGGTPFRMYKFRTMVENADKIGGPSTSGDDPRLTPVGAWLRARKLDELPQLWNVVKGEMSLVGPRPEVPAEVEKYTAEERRLLDVRPGITDWSSLKFHDEAEILRGAADPHAAYLERIRPGKVRLGLEYVRRRSLATDLGILALTAATLLGGRSRLHAEEAA